MLTASERRLAIRVVELEERVSTLERALLAALGQVVQGDRKESDNDKRDLPTHGLIRVIEGPDG